MKDSEIHIGDRVRIRDWDDMAAEFEVDADGDIKIKLGPIAIVWFVRDMRHLCGREFTVEEICEGAVIPTYETTDRDISEWTIVARMLEPAGDPEPVSAPEDSGGLFSFLLSQ